MKPNDNSNQENKNSMTQNEPNGENSSYISDKYSVTEKSGNSSKMNEDISQEKRSKTEYDGNIGINFNNDQNLDLGINSERKDIYNEKNNIYNNKVVNLPNGYNYEYQNVIISNDSSIKNSNINNNTHTSNISNQQYQSYQHTYLYCDCCYRNNHCCCYYMWCCRGCQRLVSCCDCGCRNCNCNNLCDCKYLFRGCNCLCCKKCICDNCLKVCFDQRCCDGCLNGCCNICCKALCSIF